jgi:hypothetical protein
MSTSFTIGNRFKLRDKSQVEIIRCLRHTEPAQLTRNLPPLDGEDIREGMLLVADSGTYHGNSVIGWRKAQSADAADIGRSFFISTMDQDAHDVIRSGGLVAIPCREAVELLTGYYLLGEDQSAALDMTLTAGDDGVLVPAAEGQVVVAKISEVGPSENGTFPSLKRRVLPVHVEDPSVIQIITTPGVAATVVEEPPPPEGVDNLILFGGAPILFNDQPIIFTS